MRSDSWIAVVSLLICDACQGSVVGVADSDGDETSAVDDRWSLCDDTATPEPPDDAGACAGGVPAGEIDDVQAEAIFGRTTHELDHLRDVMQGVDTSLFELDGDDISARTDSGYVVARIQRDDGTARACMQVTFACWTGGHGGFGPSALDGRVEALVDGDGIEARGELGLSDGEALAGAPAGELWVRIDDGGVEGDVGAFAF
jgi:hypothetical protein